MVKISLKVLGPYAYRTQNIIDFTQGLKKML